jgi:hypothetical protein
MWPPSCILEQSRFQPAIVCKTRVLLIASATARFIGVAILRVPTASAKVMKNSLSDFGKVARANCAAMISLGLSGVASSSAS